MALTTFDFEKPIVEIEGRLEELGAKKRKTATVKEEIASLRKELTKTRQLVYSNLTAYQRVLLARHLARPHSLDYINALTEDFVEIHGDRAYSDDRSVICGFAHFSGRSCVVIGQQKGHDTKTNLERNFGMMLPDGYRKALRVMKLGSKFGLPIIVFIDTPGAYAGVQAEERGQFEAIARNIRDMFSLRTPIVATVIGEGASGGAIGIGVGDRVLMMEYSWYSVISPESCASILWRDPKYAPEAAEALKLTASDLDELGVIDEIIKEPLGGAHRDREQVFEAVGESVSRHIAQLCELPVDELMKRRFEKYRAMGQWEE
jgi:acetyl-CoA carboxylase carboxyl transferase subunit alpha